VAILSDDELARRAARLEWLLFDVDGVMTDGRLIYGPEGERLKVFDVRDGLGMKLAQRSGLKVGILSGRVTAALEVRARELGVNALIMDRSDKGPAFSEFLAERATTPERVAYLGDDLVDLPVIRRCGLSFSPADAVAEVRAQVDCVLSRRGGQGAVREMCEMVLKARNAWEGLLASYREGE
jgi:3-deoxy-D-manno-octulosonate 8-phosphate phosphatase (KDO 8-P phosphatase)